MTLRLRDLAAVDPELASRSGVVIEDSIQRQQFRLLSETPLQPREGDPDDHYYPVDRTWSVETTGLEVPSVPAAYVRDADGQMLSEVDHHERAEYDDGTYILELNGPIKILVRFAGTFEIATSGDWTSVSFPERRAVRLGARSFHNRPAGTVTIPPSVEGLATAVETCTSSLKTTSCERSFPTLRGHPPRIRVGDDLHVPDDIDPVRSSLTVETPPDVASLLTVAPLVYYLAADVEFGETSTIHGPGFSHALDAAPSLFESVRRVLQRVFLLDAVVRTEGYYQVDLDERAAVERRTDLEIPSLYGAPIHRQVRRYLGVDHGTVSDLIPRWSLGADVVPTVENASALPYLLDDLGLVRAYDPGERRQPHRSGPDGIDELVRLASPPNRATADEDDGDVDDLVFRSPDAMAVEDHLWIGDGVPVDAAKFLSAGYEHALGWRGEGDIDVAVVCNDEEMMDELLDARLYGNRESLTMDVTVSLRETCDELRDTFAAGHDFVHYIGHVRDRRFECADDEYLPVEALDTVETGAFLINGCQSYRVGRELVERGSAGGIVTTCDVGNRGAVRVGQTIAKLLDCGFSLNQALQFARRKHSIGGDYLAIGKVGTTLTPAKGAPPSSSEVVAIGEGRYEITIKSHPSRDHHALGSLCQPHLPGVDNHYLSFGEMDTFSVDETGLFRFLSLEDQPVKFNGEWTWAENLLDSL